MVTRFQFLIGRLVTAAQLEAQGTEMAFQFLIGRLVTWRPLRIIVRGVGFQFLIGRLVTTVLTTAPCANSCFNSS